MSPARTLEKENIYESAARIKLATNRLMVM